MASESYSYSSSSMKLLLFMVPLIIVAGLVSVLGPNPSNWVLIPNQPLLWSSVTTSSSESGSLMEKVQAVSFDFHNNNKEVKAISDDDTFFNQSSTPPLSIQTLQKLVRD